MSSLLLMNRFSLEKGRLGNAADTDGSSEFMDELSDRMICAFGDAISFEIGR
jgi:hypothetical protein